LVRACTILVNVGYMYLTEIVASNNLEAGGLGGLRWLRGLQGLQGLRGYGGLGGLRGLGGLDDFFGGHWACWNRTDLTDKQVSMTLKDVLH
jgi:hypothetical protein